MSFRAQGEIPMALLLLIRWIGKNIISSKILNVVTDFPRSSSMLDDITAKKNEVKYQIAANITKRSNNRDVYHCHIVTSLS